MKKLTVAAPSDNGKKNPPLTIEVADSFWARFKGLMLRKNLPENTGLLISPCNSIHMCFMRFRLDIVFLTENWEIVKISRRVLPWVGFALCPRAHMVIELPSGTADKYALAVGQKFEMMK